MVQSKAETVDQYLSELPTKRREDITVLRKIILKNLPDGFIETMQYGMISYIIPFDHYPKTYNHQPLAIVSLASQKNYMSLYLMNIYSDKKKEYWFKEEYKKSGKKLDMGKSCLRFKKIEDLPLELIAKVINQTSVKDFIEQYENSRKY